MENRVAERIPNQKCKCGAPGGFSVRPLGDQPELQIVPETAYRWFYPDTGKTAEGYPGGAFCFNCAKAELSERALRALELDLEEEIEG